MEIEVEEARLVGVSTLVLFVGLSLLTQGLVLESFSNSTSNTSNFIVLIVLWFMGLLYSLVLGNRVIICSISMVLGLGIHIDTPYPAGFVVTLGGSDSLLVSL